MGVGSWLQPASGVDTSLSEVQFATAVAYRLGVDQEPVGGEALKVFRSCSRCAWAS